VVLPHVLGTFWAFLSVFHYCTHGDEKCTQNVGPTTEGKGPLGVLGVEYGNIKMDLKGIGFVAVDRVCLTQNMAQWRDVLNMVMNFRIPAE
jgi:hypothetical protein